MVHSYTAYGLGVSSEFMLPELQPGNGSHDVEIRRGWLRSAGRSHTGTGPTVQVAPDDAWLYWPQVGAFHVADGKRITVEPVAEVTEEGIRLLLLGSVMGVLLHQRGRLLLHGSAVEINGGVALFLGHSGWGKSTMAAAFHKCGYRVVTDDIAAIDTTTNEMQIVPGFPQLKLRSDSALALGHDPEQLAALHHRIDKRGLRCAQQFAQESLPVKRIYVLAQGSTPSVELLPAADGLIELVRHSYAAGILKSTQCEPEHMLRCARIVARYGVRRLRKGESLDDLPQVLDAVVNDLNAD
jgi:hypothetical protein